MHYTYLRRYALHILSPCGFCSLPASVQIHVSKELCYVTTQTRIAHHRVVLPHIGMPPYDLEQMQAIESQLHQTPFSEQWQLPQPVACPSGCQDEVYCSQHCAAAAWVAHHSLLCCQASCPRSDAAGCVPETPSSSGNHASGSGSYASSSNNYASGNQTAASSASNRAQLPAGHAAAVREFREHADNTNDIFLVAAQAIAHTLITAHAALASGGPSNLSCWEALMKGWRPYRMGWKKVWWECVACPEDVEDEQAFRRELKDLAQESMSLLRAAIFDERFAALFELDVYGSIVGMFELNNLGIMSPSPVQEYIEAIDDLPDVDKSLIAQLGLDAEELRVDGTAYYALQSCINHSCQPNAHAMKSEHDLNCSAVIIAKHSIPARGEITISYIDESLPYEERQEALKDYGFVCRCLLCQQEH
ncbi:TPA: hypothetical protein ACH3X1_006947 [Trebouxia sp. C0004]